MVHIKKYFTIPNILTLSRLPLGFILTATIKYYSNPYYIGVLLLIIGLTDVLDGHVARNLNIVSEVGKALDPVVDKFVQIFLCIGLIQIYPNLYIFAMLYILTQMIVITLGTVVIVEKIKHVQADIVGKFTTCVFYISMCLLLLQAVPQKYIVSVFIFVVFLTILSGLYYFKRKKK